MVVQHNLTAMNANRNLVVNTSNQAKSTQKLSSGYKINTAADDAAGLSISEKMRRQIRGLNQASANAQDGISTVQTAEGALAEVTDMLQRMQQLAVKGENGTLTTADRVDIRNEVSQLMSEINRVQSTTTFNNQNLLTGEFSNKGLQVGAEAGQHIDISIASMNMDGLLDKVDEHKIKYYKADYGSLALGRNADQVTLTKTIATKVVERFSGLQNKNGANATTNSPLMSTITTLKAGEKGVAGASDNLTANDFASLNAFVKSALKTVSAQRSELGAIQNRLEHTIKNLDNIAENTTAAESAIRDTDIATEMVAYSNNQILSQAGTSMLAQANQSNQSALSLLG
jgi:flagellin